MVVQNWVIPSMYWVRGHGCFLHEASGPMATVTGEQSGMEVTFPQKAGKVRCAMVGCGGHTVGKLGHLMSTDSLPMGSCLWVLDWCPQ